MSEVIHLKQSSLKFSVAHPKVEQELRATFNDEPDAVGFSEAAKGGGGLRSVVTSVAHRCGYTVTGGQGDTCIAVRKDHLSLNSGSLLVNTPGEGGYKHSRREVDWVKFDFYGEQVFFHEAHWLNQDPHGHLKMTRAMIDQVEKHAKGRKIAFFAGDVNIPEEYDRGKDHKKPHYLFTEAGLETVWDELDKYLPTHNRFTIDILGSYIPDARVKAMRVKVHPRMFKDHHDVSAWYKIRE